MAKDGKKGRRFKQVLGAAKPEILDAGSWLGDWVNDRFGYVLNDPDHPQRGRLIHRFVGIGIESLEEGFSDHPYLDPATDAISDVLEQATPRIWGSDRAGTGGGTRTEGDGKRGSKTRAPSEPDPFAKAHSEALKERRDIPYGIPDDERRTQEDEVKARLYRELDRIAGEEDLKRFFYECVKDLRGDQENEEFPRYHAKMSRPRLVEIAQLAGIENIPTGWTRERVIEEIDGARGVQSPINEIAKRAKKAVAKIDAAAEDIGSRGLAWLERNTNDEGVLRPRKEWS